MFTPMGRPRKLPYPLYNQETNLNETSSEGLEENPFVWPDDSSERTLVPLFVSLDEWVAITSALDVGADIAYPLQYIEVIYILMRNMRYSPMICSMIIDCIMNDEDTKAAFRDFVINDEAINDHMSESVRRLTTGLIIEPLVPGDCDNSIITGRIVQLVERMNDINVDFFEIVEVGTNDEEKLEDVLEAIPGADELPFGDVIGFAESVLEQLAENYNAAVTDEWKDEVERDLWCLAQEQEDCALSFKNVFEYFQQRATSGLTLGSLLSEVFDFIIDGDFNTDDRIASAVYALQVGAILTGNEYAGMKVQTMSALMRDALPSTKWEEWDPCGTPPPDPNCESFIEEHVNWNIKLDAGTWIEEEGFASAVAFGFRNLYINRVSWIGDTITKVVVTYTTPVTNITLAYDNGAGGRAYTGSPITEVVFSAETIPGWTDIDPINGLWVIAQDAAGMTDDTRLIEICINPLE